MSLLCASGNVLIHSFPLARFRTVSISFRVEPAFDTVYDADNRISQWDAHAVTHDNDGNMTFGPLPESGLTIFVFDARNRLTAVGGVNYSYDASNNRIGMTTPNGTTRYVIDPHGDALPRVLVRKQPDESLTYYVYGIGLLYETDESDTATYYHFDHIGSTVALTDDTGEITDRVEYSAYGSVTHREGTTDTPFLYVGQYGLQTDPNGLMYMRARYFSPELRRFVNVDPIGLEASLNWYSYANNSPLMFLDPSGQWSWDQTLGVLRVVGGGFEIAAGYSLAAAGAGVSATGVGTAPGIGAIAGGVAIGTHGIDQVQAGVRQAFTGQHVDSFTSSGLQAAGMSRTSANLADAGISIVGSLGASTATATIRASQIAAESPAITQGMSSFQVLRAYDKGSQALNSADYVALGAQNTSAIAKYQMMQQSVNAAGQSYNLTTRTMQQF